MCFGPRHSHNTRKESADSSRRNVAGPILYCHRYKITCDATLDIANTFLDIKAYRSARYEILGPTLVKANKEIDAKIGGGNFYFVYAPIYYLST